MVKIGIKGRITNTNEEIMIKDDAKETGGYYIYIWHNKKEHHEIKVHDYWLESLEKVRRQIKYEGWKIKWSFEHTKNPSENNENKTGETTDSE